MSAALDQTGKRLFEILNTITFREKENQTMINLHFIVSNITPEGAPYLAGQNEGWNMSIDKLEQLLSNSMMKLEH